MAGASHSCQHASAFTKVPAQTEVIIAKQGYPSGRDVADNESFEVEIVFMVNETEDLSRARTVRLQWDGRMGNAKRNWVELEKPPN